MRRRLLRLREQGPDRAGTQPRTLEDRALHQVEDDRSDRDLGQFGRRPRLEISVSLGNDRAQMKDEFVGKRKGRPLGSVSDSLLGW